MTHEFDATIARSPFHCVVRCDRQRGSKSGGRQATGSDLVFFHQSSFHSLGPPARKIHIEIVTANVVSMSLDTEFPIGMVVQDICNLFEHFSRFGPQLVTREIEIDAVHLRAPIIGKLLFELLGGLLAPGRPCDLDHLQAATLLRQLPCQSYRIIGIIEK